MPRKARLRRVCYRKRSLIIWQPSLVHWNRWSLRICEIMILWGLSFEALGNKTRKRWNTQLSFATVAMRTRGAITVNISKWDKVMKQNKYEIDMRTEPSWTVISSLTAADVDRKWCWCRDIIVMIWRKVAVNCRAYRGSSRAILIGADECFAVWLLISSALMRFYRQKASKCQDAFIRSLWLLAESNVM